MMATTGIWKIEKRLDHVIDYVMNIEKTQKLGNYKDIHNFDEYDGLDYNTEESCYVSGINCIAETAYQEMMFTKKQYNKTDKILGFHAFQSFKGHEVTADKAHLIGLKLAEEMWGDRFEVIVTTHVNGPNIHNHFVINSVSFKDGKKYYDNRENKALFRHLSDDLCMEYGLSVLEEKKCKRSGINYDNYYKKYIGQSNYHTLAKEDLDRAIAMAYSYQDFENIMIKMGYELQTRYGKLSIKRRPYKRNIRIERAFGNNYSINMIEQRIENTTAPRVPFLEAYNPNNKSYKPFEEQKKQKAHGLYGLYKYYCYLLKIYPHQYPHTRMTPALRLEIQKMNEISEQTRLLVSNKIKTYEQFLFYKDSVEHDVSELISKKHNLWMKYKRTNDKDSKQIIRNEIDKITQKLVPIKKNARLCNDIEKRLSIVKENIKEFETEREKEEKKQLIEKS